MRSQLLLIVATALCCQLTNAALNPVILVPGDGGSQLEARLNKTWVPHYLCAKVSDWYALWLNLEQMIPTIIDCWVDNIRLVYDNKTHTTSNSPGVEVRVTGFGNTSTVEYLDESQRGFSSYFAPIAKRLVAMGYERGRNLHGAPYDFRKAANEQDQFFMDFRELIESTYKKNGNQPVILVGHSMGCIMSLYFLNHQSQAWKDQHIRAIITLSGVWAGTVRAMKVFAIGDNLGAWIISGSALKIEQRGNPSLAWLMPSEKYWPEDEVLLQSKEVNITTKNIEEFYNRLNHPENVQMLNDVRGLVRDLKAPGVEVYCLHGTGVKTTERLVYGSFPTSTPTLLKGDGDGTVNVRSLMACTKWEKEQKQKFHHHTFPNINHLRILSDDGTTEYVKNIVQSIVAEQREPVKNSDEALQTETEVYPQIEVV